MIGIPDAAAHDAAHGEPMSLWHSAGSFSIAAAAPVPGAVRLATGRPTAPNAAAAVGVRDEDGMLLYVELATPAASAGQGAAPTGGAEASAQVASAPSVEGALLDRLLKRLGCSTRVLLGRPLAVALGGDTDLAGSAVHPPSGPSVVRLLRVDAPGARRIFEDTPIVPFDRWYRLQQHRVRYFKKPKSETAPDPDPK